MSKVGRGAQTLLATVFLVWWITARAGTAARGPVTYSEIGSSVTYGEDNIAERATDDLGRAVAVGVPYPRASVTAGYIAEGVTSTQEIDAFGRPASLVTAGDRPLHLALEYGADRAGNTGAGLLKTLRLEGSGEISETFEYDERDNLKEHTTTYGRRDTFVHDEWDRPIEEVAGLSTGSLRSVGAKTQRAFDAAGHLIRERFYQAGVGWVERRIEYNDREQVTAVTETGLASPDGSLTEGVTRTTYDAYGRVASTTTPAGITTSFRYDTLGRVIATRTGASGERLQAYDEMGRLVWQSDGHESVWRTRYDAWGRPYQEELPSGAVIEREHDRAGGLLRETTFADAGKTSTLAETRTRFTSFGAIERSEEIIAQGDGAASLVRTFSYDGSGRLARIIATPTGGEARTEQTIEYEAGTGRVLATTDAAGNRAESVYTSSAPWPDRLVTHETGGDAALSVATELAYDALGRVVREVRGGTAVERTFDEAGNVLSQTLGGGDRREGRYDGRGLPLTSTRPAIGEHVAFGYDPDGRLTSTRVERNGGPADLTTLTYDAAGRLAARTRPGAGEERFTYFPDDTVATATTRLGLTVTYTYDAANRLTTVVPSGSPAASSRLMPLDGGDLIAYDPLGRLTSVGIPTAPSSLVTYSGLDLRGLPRYERVASWSQPIERRYDPFGNPTLTLLPEATAGSLAFAGFARTFDRLDRPTAVTPVLPGGDPVTGGVLGATLRWGGAGRLWGWQTGSGVGHAFAFSGSGARLASLALRSATADLGRFDLGWDDTTDLKRTRAAAAPAADPALSLTAAMGWAWSHDAGRRLAGARAGSGASDDRSAGAWTFGYGKADELLFAQQSTQGLSSFTSGPEGRLLERSTPDGSEAFLYDLEGRRIGDGRFLLTHDWRGRLVQIDVKPGSGVKGPAGDALDGHRILYTYDAVGRLLTRAHQGATPEGGSDHERPFIARRAFTWDGDTLAAEAGLNFHDEVIWRAQYLPGPSGLDDSPQVLLDTDLLTDHPRQAVYAYLRDELGSVIGLLDEGSTSGADPPRLLARYLYTPYGEAHLETGPELLRIELDASTTQVGGQQQTAAPGESVPGALRVETTLPLDSEPLTEGLRLERYDAGTLQWVVPSQSDLAIGHDEAKPEALLIVPLSGWSVGQRYRITLLPTLEDGYGRRIQLPREEHSGVVVLLEVPGDGTTPPAYLRDFELLYDSAAAAAATLCEPHEDGSCRPRLPGGQTSLFQGLWVDPLTGYAHARQRVLDTRTGVWLQEDPIGPVDSENLYSFVAWQPSAFVDPTGECLFGIGGTCSEWAASGARQLEKVKEKVRSNVGGGTSGVAADFIVSAGVDVVDMLLLDPLRVGEATGLAVGEGAGAGAIALGVVQDVGRGAAVAAGAVVTLKAAVRGARAVRAATNFDDLTVATRQGLREGGEAAAQYFDDIARRLPSRPTRGRGQAASPVTGGPGTTAQHAAELSRNLAREGRAAKVGQAAGHIVPSMGTRGHWEAGARARALLQRYRIGVDDAANGIPIGHPRPHSSMHTRIFVQGLEARLLRLSRTMADRGYGFRAIRSALRRELRIVGRGLQGS